MDLNAVNFESIQDAVKLLTGKILETPMSSIKGKHDFNAESEVFLKLENFQLTGSFKVRGALNKLSHLSKEEAERGVIAVSAGNHAQGVAYGASLLGIDSHIVMPKASPLVKIEATRAYGANVILHGDYFDQAADKAYELAKEHNYTFVHPYEDPFVISGQGTIGIEICESIKDLKTLVIPIGGGGLISGIAVAVKHYNPKCRIIGVVSSTASNMQNLYYKQAKIKNKSINTIADGIAIKNPSEGMYKFYISKYVDEIVSVSDQEVAQAIVFLMEKVKTVAEGSGAAGMAAVLAKKIQLKGTSCILICGGNIDLNTVSRVIETGLRTQGRLFRIGVIVDDLPGNLLRLTQGLAELEVNILEVNHDRVSSHLNIRETLIDFMIETKNQSHILEVKNLLKNTLGVRCLLESQLIK